MNTTCPRLMISATKGGSGKTFLTLGIIVAWRKKCTSFSGGHDSHPSLMDTTFPVAAFKKGPDFIDAAWLARAAGAPCYNLDLFLIGRDQSLESFVSRSKDAQVAVVEGNRGLYDGIDIDGSNSTAEIAKLIEAPVILIVDCSLATRTVASVVLGCQKLDPEVNIAGVILNRVILERHEKVVRGAIEKYCDVPVVGAIPKLSSSLFPERHMGLLPPPEHHEPAGAINDALHVAEKYLDLDSLWKIASSAPSLSVKSLSSDKETDERRDKKKTPKIGILQDTSFQFYYPENLEALERSGGELVVINALEDTTLPPVDALYIGGGFPETNAEHLSANQRFRSSLKKTIEDGLPVYAECGGLIYLGEGLLYNGKKYPMVGVLPLTFGFGKRPSGHGYTIVEVIQDNPFFPVGFRFHGHEFHYSHVIDCDRDKLSFAFRVERGMGIMEGLDGIIYKNVLATYTHLHALGVPQWTQGFNTACDL